MEYQAKNTVMQQIINLVEKNTTKNWSLDWDWIIENPNITIEFIEKYPDKPWDWKYISCIDNLTMEIIDKYPDKPWDWDEISGHQNLTMKIIEKYPDKPWNWQKILGNGFKTDYKNELSKLQNFENVE